MNTQPPGRQVHMGTIVGGSIVVAVGVSTLIDGSLASVRPGRLIGPMVMMVLGAAIMLAKSQGCRDHAAHERRVDFGHLWLIWLGAWMMISQAHVFGLTYRTSWPLLLIGMGIVMVLRGAR